MLRVNSNYLKYSSRQSGTLGDHSQSEKHLKVEVHSSKQEVLLQYSAISSDNKHGNFSMKLINVYGLLWCVIVIAARQIHLSLQMVHERNTSL